MSELLPCLRRTEPSAALIPHAGQRKLAYVPAEQSDIRRRMLEFNRTIAAHPEPGASSGADPAEVTPAKSSPLDEA